MGAFAEVTNKSADTAQLPLITPSDTEAITMTKRLDSTMYPAVITILRSVGGLMQIAL